MDLKDRIINQAGELFVKYGVKSISMDEIASKLGISKRTIYQNFIQNEQQKTPKNNFRGFLNMYPVCKSYSATTSNGISTDTSLCSLAIAK